MRTGRTNEEISGTVVNDFVNCWKFPSCAATCTGSRSMRIANCTAASSSTSSISIGKNGGKLDFLTSDMELARHLLSLENKLTVPDLSGSKRSCNAPSPEVYGRREFGCEAIADLGVVGNRFRCSAPVIWHEDTDITRTIILEQVTDSDSNYGTYVLSVIVCIKNERRVACQTSVDGRSSGCHDFM